MNLIHFILSGRRHQYFSQEQHGDDFQDKADRFHRIHENAVVSREHLTPRTMQLISMSTQSATLVTEDGRTVIVTEGQPVQVLPQDITPVEPVAPVEETPEAPVEAAPVEAEATPAPEEVPADPAQ